MLQNELIDSIEKYRLSWMKTQNYYNFKEEMEKTVKKRRKAYELLIGKAKWCNSKEKERWYTDNVREVECTFFIRLLNEGCYHEDFLKGISCFLEYDTDLRILKDIGKFDFVVKKTDLPIFIKNAMQKNDSNLEYEMDRDRRKRNINKKLVRIPHWFNREGKYKWQENDIFNQIRSYREENLRQVLAKYRIKKKGDFRKLLVFLDKIDKIFVLFSGEIKDETWLFFDFNETTIGLCLVDLATDVYFDYIQF